MKKMRIWMIVLSILWIVSLVSLTRLTPAIHDGGSAKDWMGIVALLMTGSVIGNVVISALYASKTCRNPALWAIGALFIPFVPAILALLPTTTAAVEVSSEKPLENPQNSAPTLLKMPEIGSMTRTLFTSFPDTGAVFNYKDRLSGTSQWPLDRMRLFSFVVPGSFKWRVITSSQELMFLFPDLMPANEADDLYRLLDELCQSSNGNAFSEINLCMAGYDTTGTVLNLHRMKKMRAALLAGLYRTRAERVTRLTEWLSGNPEVTLRGSLGSRATLNKSGFHLKKRSLSWPEVKSINTETTNGLVTHLFVLPEGRSGGMFDLQRGKYALARIPTKKKLLYAAECFFWKNLIAR